MTDFGQRRRQLLKTGQTTSYVTGDDGDLEKGLARSLTVLTTGQQAATTLITINAKTHSLSNNLVQDNSTGLTWARYVPDADIGPAADGKLFWEQYTITGESVTFAAAGDTITAAAGNPFDTDALCVGRKIAIAGTVNNNGTVTVSAIAGNVITCAENLIDEGPIAADFATVDDLIQDLLDQAKANALGGYTDWQIPNAFQLLSLVDFGTLSPSIDTTAFPSTPKEYHWASTTRSGNPINVWLISFSEGYTYFYSKTGSKFYCRLVRGE